MEKLDVNLPPRPVCCIYKHYNKPNVQMWFVWLLCVPKKCNNRSGNPQSRDINLNHKMGVGESNHIYWR